MLLPFRVDPFPFSAQYNWLVNGMNTTPRVTSPSLANAIETEKSGLPMAKFAVPSRGSIIHSVSGFPSFLPASSLQMECSGNARPMCFRMHPSDCVSELVTMSCLSFECVSGIVAKFRPRIAPASLAALIATCLCEVLNCQLRYTVVLLKRPPHSFHD
jgi:hypothetical protein